MTQYIDKAALVAEVVARYDECLKRAKIIDAEYWNGKADAYRDMLVVLGSPKIKEVDFINEFHTFSEKHKLMDKDIEFSDIEKTASFFFQLGLKAQKGE